MNQVLIDNGLLLLAGLCALFITLRMRSRRYGFLPSVLLLFAPLIVLGNMWGHTIAVLLVNLKRYQEGAFQYTFTFYGHMLLGAVFILVSSFGVHHVRKHLRGDPGQKRTILWLNAATALGFLPLIPLNPIGALPVLAALLSTVTLLIIRGRQPVLHGSQRSILYTESTVEIQQA